MRNKYKKINKNLRKCVEHNVDRYITIEIYNLHYILRIAKLNTLIAQTSLNCRMRGGQTDTFIFNSL